MSSLFARVRRFRVPSVARMVAEQKERLESFTGSCPIREHTGDGAYVGRCDFATYDGYCPRHGALEDYPDRDDREVSIKDRRHP